MKKYELTNEVNGLGFHRIRALVDIPRHNVKAGDLGGWIQSEENLSQDGDCWIADEARVYGNAKVRDNATVGGMSHIFDNADVFGDAMINGTVMNDNASVSGSSQCYGNTLIYGEAKVSGISRIYGQAHVNHDVHDGSEYEHNEFEWIKNKLNA